MIGKFINLSLALVILVAVAASTVSAAGTIDEVVMNLIAVTGRLDTLVLDTSTNSYVSGQYTERAESAVDIARLANGNTAIIRSGAGDVAIVNPATGAFVNAFSLGLTALKVTGLPNGNLATLVDNGGGGHDIIITDVLGNTINQFTASGSGIVADIAATADGNIGAILIIPRTDIIQYTPTGVVFGQATIWRGASTVLAALPNGNFVTNLPGSSSNGYVFQPDGTAVVQFAVSGTIKDIAGLGNGNVAFSTKITASRDDILSYDSTTGVFVPGTQFVRNTLVPFIDAIVHRAQKVASPEK